MKKILLFSSILLSLFASCKKGGSSKLIPTCDGTHPTYNAQIKVIIEGNCNTTGCHSAGSANGDFTSYAGLTSVISNGSFNKSVLVDQTMPKGSATLSQKNINLIQCWVNDNYPQN